MYGEEGKDMKLRCREKKPPLKMGGVLSSRTSTARVTTVASDIWSAGKADIVARDCELPSTTSSHDKGQHSIE